MINKLFDMLEEQGKHKPTNEENLFTSILLAVFLIAWAFAGPQ